MCVPTRRWPDPSNSPTTSDPERRAVLHGDGIRLLCSLALNRLPLKETVHRHDAAPPDIGVPEHRQPGDRLRLGIDRLATALRVFAPVRDEPPFQEIQGPLTRLMVLTDDQ